MTYCLFYKKYFSTCNIEIHICMMLFFLYNIYKGVCLTFFKSNPKH